MSIISFRHRHDRRRHRRRVHHRRPRHRELHRRHRCEKPPHEVLHDLPPHGERLRVLHRHWHERPLPHVRRRLRALFRRYCGPLRRRRETRSRELLPRPHRRDSFRHRR